MGYRTRNQSRVENRTKCTIMSSHSLRHSFISILVNDENRDIASIAEIVGYNDIRVTLKICKTYKQREENGYNENIGQSF